MDGEGEVLLEEMREEINYLYEQIQQKSDRASSIIRFNFLAITLVIGFVRLGNRKRFELETGFIGGGVILGLSILIALYCLVLASKMSRPSSLTPPPKLSDEKQTIESRTEGDEEVPEWIGTRIQVLGERLKDYQIRNWVLSDALIIAVTSGPLGEVILLTFTLDNVEGIKRGPLGTEGTIVFSVVLLLVFVWIAMKTIEGARTGTLPSKRYKLDSDE